MAYRDFVKPDRKPAKRPNRAKQPPNFGRSDKPRHFTEVLGYFWSSFVLAGGLVIFSGIVYFVVLLLQPLETDSIIVKGNKIIQTETILNTALANGKTFKDSDILLLTKMLHRHPWIEDTKIRLIPPSFLEINITERQPVAFFKTTSGIDPIDRYGTRLPLIYDSEGTMSLPLVVHNTFAPKVDYGERITLPSLKSALNLIKVLEEIDLPSTDEVSVIDISNPFSIKMTLVEDNISLYLGESDFAKKLARLKPYFAQAGEKEKITSLDLRYENKIIVRK